MDDLRIPRGLSKNPVVLDIWRPWNPILFGTALDDFATPRDIGAHRLSAKCQGLRLGISPEMWDGLHYITVGYAHHLHIICTLYAHHMHIIMYLIQAFAEFRRICVDLQVSRRCSGKDSALILLLSDAPAICRDVSVSIGLFLILSVQVTPRIGAIGIPEKFGAGATNGISQPYDSGRGVSSLQIHLTDYQEDMPKGNKSF